MQEKPKSSKRTAPGEDRRSLTTLMVVLALTNVWLFSQVAPYVH
jgi:hypothetical protein